ncbi:acetylglutamate kinase [Peribacillus muralis]|uniref:acetylglutamate kinase n=1 Tax=Peribacillus muralis TaxID=264697 RepID=UPI001F4DD5BF|nr:acetylglutamate kinase [Peribacillus muralis]MCK1992870.1 acetylglutamate kinase [Peribacillus muralis]MCK2013425.1 acetylglutamate kinase [Peribacillus muralis]
MNILVIKCGGSIINELSKSFFHSVNQLQNRGYHIVFVHGGGPDINSMMEKLEIEPVFEDGLRKTTSEVLAIVELMLTGKSNRSLVHQLEAHGIKAVGLSGSDAGILTGEFIDEQKLGAVGEIQHVNTELLRLLLEKGYCPVMTPISTTEAGIKLNVNADMAAGSVARALSADMCLFVTDVKGVLKDDRILDKLTESETLSLIKDGSIHGGMIPKVHTALSVLDKGVGEVMIVSGKDQFYQAGQFIGTKFLQEEGVSQ